MRSSLLMLSLVSCAFGCADDTYSDGDAASDADTDVDADTDADSDADADVDPNAGVCCGADCTPSCTLPEQECCFDGATSCVPADSCAGTGVSACDGPEDCVDATCCWEFAERVSSRCTDECTFDCGANMQRCHASTDCPAAQPTCCFVPLPPTGAVGQCVDAACRDYVNELFGGPVACDD